MLLPSEINYFDLEVISAYRGKWFDEDLLESHEIMLEAIEKAKNINGENK